MNLLLTSVGRRSYMVRYFQEALGHEGCIHAANSEYSFAMQTADKWVLTPLIYDEKYVDFLIAYCLKNEITAVLSLFDIDLPVLAKNKECFDANGITLIVSSYEVTQVCNDKWQTMTSMRSIGVSAPDSYLSLTECEDALRENRLAFPVIIKPRWGMGSIGIHQAESFRELHVLYEKTKNDIFRTYLKYESSVEPEHSVILQEKLNGIEYGLDVLNDLDGAFLTCVPKRKLAMRAGETDSAEVVEDEGLFELGRKLSGHLHHVGNLDVDCFKTDGKNSVLELNARFGGQYPFSHLAGVNFPKAIISMLKHEPVEASLLCATPGTVGIKNIVPCTLTK